MVGTPSSSAMRGPERTSDPSSWSPSTRKIVKRSALAGGRGKAVEALKKEQATKKEVSVPFQVGSPHKPIVQKQVVTVVERVKAGRRIIKEEKKERLPTTIAIEHSSVAAIVPYKKETFVGGDRVTTIEEARKRREREESPIRSSVFQPVESKIEKAEEYVWDKAPMLSPYVTFGIGVGAGLVSFAKMFAYPVKTAKGLYYMVRYPRETGIAFGEKFMAKPTFVMGEIVGTAIGAKGLGIVAGKVAKVSPVKLEYEAFKYTTPAGETKVFGRTFGVKVGAKGYPIITSKLKVPERLGAGVEFQPRTAIGASIFERRIVEFIKKPTKMLVEGKEISPVLQQEFAVKGLRAVREVGGQKSKFLDMRFLTEGTERLSPKATQALLKVIKKEKGMVFGSGATMPQLKSTIRRGIGDIDVYIKTGQELRLEGIAKSGLKAIKKTGVKARIVKGEPYHIETFVDKQWVKAVEFKGIGIGDAEALQIPSKAFGYELDISKYVRKTKQVDIAALPGEAYRKTAASISIRQEQALGVAHTGRFKDIPDFFKIIKTQAESRILPSPKAHSFLKLSEQMKIDISGSPSKILLYAPPSKVSAPSYYIPSIPSKVSYTPIKAPKEYYPVSPKVYKYPSVSPRVSPYPSPKPYKSPYISPSPSPYISPKMSPYPSPKPYKSPYASPYTPPSPYLSPYPSPKAYKSPYPYIAEYTSPSPYVPPFIVMDVRKRKKKKEYSISRAFEYDPSVQALVERRRGKAPTFGISIKERPITPKWERKMSKLMGGGFF